MKQLTKNEWIIRNAIRLADEHRKNCDETCHITLGIFIELFDKAGIALTVDEVAHFL